MYAAAPDAKGLRARALLADGGCISVQVLNEFAHVSRRKLGMDWPEIGRALDMLCTSLDPPLPITVELHLAARVLADAHRMPFYDALIVAAAQAAECDALVSEDFQTGRAFGRLVVTNPFA